MLKSIKTVALSALIGLGALAAVPASAEAGNFYLGIGGGHNKSGVEIRFGERHHWDRRHHRGHRHHWERPRHHHQACTPGHALNKAGKMGVRSARVREVNSRFIRVHGYGRGGHVAVTFARTPNCPVVRWS